MIDSAKYFKTTAAGLKLTGPTGASDVSKFFALLKREGALEGSIAGTSATSFFQQFTANKEKLKKLKQETGIDLQFFDEKGEFKGLDNAFQQMEQFRKLSGEARLEALNEIFGEQGGKVAGVMVEGGALSWRNVTAEAGKAVKVNEKINQQMELYNSKVEALQGSIKNLTATAFLPWSTPSSQLSTWLTRASARCRVGPRASWNRRRGCELAALRAWARQ